MLGRKREKRKREGITLGAVRAVTRQNPDIGWSIYIGLVPLNLLTWTWCYSCSKETGASGKYGCLLEHVCLLISCLLGDLQKRQCNRVVTARTALGRAPHSLVQIWWGWSRATLHWQGGLWTKQITWNAVAPNTHWASDRTAVPSLLLSIVQNHRGSLLGVQSSVWEAKVGGLGQGHLWIQWAWG